ncbi:hypothetical protein KIW84_054142 [Lathyrus oleraceus]|uniref:Reverse transcriptase zinc-binding domain-containing protein n=1 Tax=Pisum sativum TaxID=3888 RepID=A0A9D5AE65_PEA|nr:hypothetical protein KIW84_054142 [Pisum sativum]
MYGTLFHNSNDEAYFRWQKIWHLQVPERIRTFIWKMSHKWLITNDFLNHLQLHNNICDICGTLHDSILHSLRDCTFSKAFWSTVVSHAVKDHFFTSSLLDWIDVRKDVSVYCSMKGYYSRMQPVSMAQKITSLCPPPLRWVCLNTDGIILSGSVAKCGGIFRDNLAWKRGFKKLLIQIDNSSVVSDLLSKSTLQHQRASLTRHIPLRLHLFE